MSHWVVRARPLRSVVLIGLGVALLMVLFGWGIFEVGRYQGGYRLLDSLDAERKLHEQTAALRRESVRLREQNAILSRSATIDREAYKELESSVIGLQEEIMELKHELNFYRGILAPSDASRGLEVQRFALQKLAGERYQYTMVLTQVLDNSSTVQGSVEFVVEGSENGNSKRYTLAELSEAEGELDFRYRYFQSFEGELRLPEGFVPERVNLNVKPRGRTYRPFTRSFDWVVRES